MLEKSSLRPREIAAIGVASCLGAQEAGCASAPLTMRHLRLKDRLEKHNIHFSWTKTLLPLPLAENDASRLFAITQTCKQLARQIKHSLFKHQQFVVIGGDHSCAIGTWSGAYAAIQSKGALGLIWIDAHMDSHLPETSPSNAIHGMPVAALLGYGYSDLTQIESSNPKIKPENLCLVGIRSFEKEEAELLDQLGVKIFYMSDIQQLGLNKVLQLAQQHVTASTVAYGISLDLDAIDPRDAPGIGSPEPGGLAASELLNALANLNYESNFLGIEVTELNPEKDVLDITANVAMDIIETVMK